MGCSQLASLDAVAHFAESSPQSPALIDPDGATLSYGELWTQIEMLSCRLEEAGIGAGESVAVLLTNCGQQILVVAGVLNRHIAVPLQTTATTMEVATFLRTLSVSALIAAPEFEAQIEAAVSSGVTVLVARSGEPATHWEIRVPAIKLKPRNAYSEAVIFWFTSATTGGPKVVPVTAANFNARVRSVSGSAELTASDRQLLMISQGFGVAVVYAHAQFLAGGAVIATGGFDPASFLSWLNNLRPTFYTCAPAVHQAALVQLRLEPPSRPVSLRFIESSFAPLPDEVRQELEQVLGVPLLGQYGATEAGIIASESPSFREHVPNSIGRARGLEIGIMNSSGMLLPSGEEGEIAVRGTAVASSYVDNPEATRAAFRGGWYWTGDAGRLDADGNLYLTGRLKEIINRGGEKIAPGEVDAVITSHPAVLDAATFAVPHPTLGEDVACAVVLREGSEAQVSAQDLHRYAAERLAAFKAPYRIYFVDQIPRGELGKPQRRVLADEFGKKRGAAPTPAEVTKQILENVAVVYLHEIWERILDRNDLEFDENFFEAGGDSLAAISMLAEVDKRFGSETSAQAASFIDEPTLAQLARLIEASSPPETGNRNSSEMQGFPVSDQGCSMRLFCFPADGFEGLPFRRLAKHLQGQMDLSIVRPANTWHSRSLFIFENSAAEAAALIRELQPQGPYFLCGDCFGGVVATETAHQLSLAGQEVRVILLDTLLPGFPRFLRDWRIWMGAIGPQWRRLWTSDHPGVRKNLRTLGRRAIWSAVVPFRRFLAPIHNVPTMRRIFEWAQDEHYPFYCVFALDAPFLHILSADEPSALTATAAAGRFGWREYARGGLEEQYVPFDHNNVLHESNLPEIVEILRQWCGIHSSAAH